MRGSWNGINDEFWDLCVSRLNPYPSWKAGISLITLIYYIMTSKLKMEKGHNVRGKGKGINQLGVGEVGGK